MCPTPVPPVSQMARMIVPREDRVFGDLFVDDPYFSFKPACRKFRARCTCGCERFFRAGELTSGRRTHCGCKTIRPDQRGIPKGRRLEIDLSDPVERRAYRLNARARQIGAEGSCTGASLVRIRKLQLDRCAYCRMRLKGRGVVDHIVPLAGGGSNWPRNLQWACVPCNSAKHARDPISFAQSLGLLI